jgi:type II secretory pathway component PulJ
MIALANKSLFAVILEIGLHFIRDVTQTKRAVNAHLSLVRKAKRRRLSHGAILLECNQPFIKEYI